MLLLQCFLPALFLRLKYGDSLDPGCSSRNPVSGIVPLRVLVNFLMIALTFSPRNGTFRINFLLSLFHHPMAGLLPHCFGSLLFFLSFCNWSSKMENGCSFWNSALCTQVSQYFILENNADRKHRNNIVYKHQCQNNCCPYQRSYWKGYKNSHIFQHSSSTKHPRAKEATSRCWLQTMRIEGKENVQRQCSSGMKNRR